jgi:hypothetical protein
MSIMTSLSRYKKKEGVLITAVRLDLETAGFTYEKWGGTQTCKAGDWVVDNNGNTYTIDADVFKRTYRHVGNGQYQKSVIIFAEQASHPGTIKTKEGTTDYKKGDYLVYNNHGRQDGYAMSEEDFYRMYEAAGNEEDDS